MRSLNDVMAALPEHRLKRVEGKAAKIIRAVSLHQIREARRLTQNDISAAMGVPQNNVSRLEKKQDMLLSTLGRYVESAGGRLRIIAEMPGDQSIELDLQGKPARPRKADKIAAQG